MKAICTRFWLSTLIITPLIQFFIIVSGYHLNYVQIARHEISIIRPHWFDPSGISTP